MCCVKDEKLGPEKKSVLLNLLSVAYPLEERKQKTVFRMIGAQDQIRKQKVIRARKLGQFLPDLEEASFCRSFLREIKSLVEPKVVTWTQAERKKAIRAIKSLITRVIKHGKSDDLTPAGRVKWFRVVGYLYQVQRSIMHEYDADQFQQELEHLKKVVDSELRKAKAKRAKKSS